jgi:hypothetical protein
MAKHMLTISAAFDARQDRNGAVGEWHNVLLAMQRDCAGF